MRYRYPICVLTALTMLAATACAQQPPARDPAPSPAAKAVKPSGLTLDKLLANMEAARQQLAESKHKTFRAKITKTHHVVYIDDTETYTGKLEFKMPRLLRLSLKRDGTDDETVAIVGEKYGWLYDTEKKDGTRMTLPPVEEQKKSANPLEYGLAKSIHGLRDAYLLQMQAPEKAGDVEAIPLVLTPRGGETYDEGKTIFWIDPKTWLPVQVRQYLSNNEIVDTYTLTDVEMNVKIKDSVFEPPRGVDFVDLDEN